MDPRIEKLRAAGFSDADIAEYLKDTPPSTADAGGGAEQEPPSVSPVVPETQANNVVPGTGMMEGLATAAAGISPSADTLTKIGEGALAYKVGEQPVLPIRLERQQMPRLKQGARHGSMLNFLLWQDRLCPHKRQYKLLLCKQHSLLLPLRRKHHKCKRQKVLCRSWH